MLERENKPIKTIVILYPEEALTFVQWAMTTLNIGCDIPEPEWQTPKTTEENPTNP